MASRSTDSRHGGRSHGRSRDESDDEDDNRHRSSTEYKKLYKDAKHELKRKRRDYYDLEDKLDNEEKEMKKAKQDTQDLWKIYYQLQTELQQSYERNAKLSAEKSKLQREHDDAQTELDSGSANPVKLRDALIAMHKEKISMQRKYNEMIMANKSLREKESRYGPRLAEMDKAERNMDRVREECKQMTLLITRVVGDMKAMGCNKDSVEKYQRWNSLLSLECDQAMYRVRDMEQHRDAEGCLQRRQLRTNIDTLRKTVHGLREDWRWTTGGVTETIDGARRLFDDCAHNVNRLLDKAKHIPSTTTKEREECMSCVMKHAAHEHTMATQKDDAIARLHTLRKSVAVVMAHLQTVCGELSNTSLATFATNVVAVERLVDQWLTDASNGGTNAPPSTIVDEWQKLLQTIQPAAVTTTSSNNVLSRSNNPLARDQGEVWRGGGGGSDEASCPNTNVKLLHDMLKQ